MEKISNIIESHPPGEGGQIRSDIMTVENLSIDVLGMT